MKTLTQHLVLLALGLGTVFPASATVLVDDTWADGMRTNDVPGPPSSTRWFCDNAASLTATPGSMIASNDAAPRQYLTYFTTNPASPVDLQIGETLKITMEFRPTNPTADSTTRTLRIGLFNYADGGVRATEDSDYVKDSGQNVSGYWAAINCAQSLIDSPIEFRARTNMSGTSLMGTSADYMTVGGTGPRGTTTNTPGFASGSACTLVFSAKRYAEAVVVTTTILGDNGLAVSWMATDTNHLYRRFDAFAIRCSSAAETAELFTFTRFKVELLPPFTPVSGLYLNDTWADGDRTTQDLPGSARWFANDTGGASLIAKPGAMIGYVPPGTSRTWMTYFTDMATNPVTLGVGQRLKATITFIPTNVHDSVSTSWGLRYGLFNYADGGTRPPGDAGVVANSGANVTGYFVGVNFTTNFTANPLHFYLRTNLPSINLMGTTADYFDLGDGPTGYTNAPALVSGTEHTLEFSISRYATSNVLSAKLTGGGNNLDIAYAVVDTWQSNYYRFDALAMRFHSARATADIVTFTKGRVEVVPIEPPVTPFRITALERLTADAAKLTWAAVPGKAYQIQSCDALAAGGWVTNGTVVATGTSASFTNSGLSGVPRRFYRVVHTP